MKIRSLGIAAAALLLPFTAVACSEDDSTGDLDKSEVVDQIKAGAGGMLTDEQVDCMADAVMDADFTKEEIENGDFAGDDSYIQATADCMGVEIPEGMTIPQG